MVREKCRWGILSTAGIAKKNWRGIRLSGNGVVQAVASRDLHSAEKFITECQREVSFESQPVAVQGYDELLRRDDIDAVYIPLPTGMRAEWVVKAIQAGKHVLAEKPAGVDASEVKQILQAAQQKNVQYMDGVMFMHSQRLQQLRAVLDDGQSVGNIKRIATHFSFLGDDEFRKSNIRTNSQFEPHGCLGDLGWYCIRMILWSLNYKLPTKVMGRILTPLQGQGSKESVPGEFSAELFFEGGISANFYCSFLTQHQQWVHISGDKGFVELDDFVLPFFAPEVGFDASNNHFHIQGCDFNMERHRKHYSVNEYANGQSNSQEVNMVRNFANHVLSGKVNHDWGQIVLKTQTVLDALWKSARNGNAVIEIA
jgi:predicted dehydrogenase